MKKILLPLFILILLLVFKTQVNASALATVSDTITTSRPSASAPLSADVAASVNSFSVVSNGSTFLASDSAQIWGNNPESGIKIATTSADKTKLYLTTASSALHSKGSAVTAPQTAMHKVQFVNQTPINTGDTIEIVFPASLATDSNPASPSAATFMFNGISGTNIKFYSSESATTTCSWAATITAGATQKLTCTVATANIPTGSTITALIGCSANTTTTCTTQVPTLINPAKTAGPASADTWKLTINTYSGGTNLMDTGSTKIGTFDSVNVVASVDETLTIAIAGVANGGAACTDTTNSGFDSTPTDVNLGTLTSGAINLAAQTVTITTNALNGYTMTATSSGHLISSGTGYFIRDAQGDPTANNTPVPAAIAAGTAAFGIHPCGTNVDTSPWGTGGGASNKYANPSVAYSYTLASATAPVSSNAITVEYGATVAATTPAGDYRTVLTYVVTPTF